MVFDRGLLKAFVNELLLKECFTGENTPPLPCYVLIQLYI